MLKTQAATLKLQAQDLAYRNKLEKEEAQLLKRDFFDEFEYVEDATFILCVLQRKQNGILFKWFIGLVFTIAGIVISIWKLVSTPNNI